MTRRHWTLAGIALAAAVLAVWIARNSYWTEQTVIGPPQGEAAVNGLYAARQLAEQLGVRTEWQRELASLPPRGVLLVSRWNWDLIPRRRARIEAWVENGGRLIVDGSMLDNAPALAAWSGVWRRRLEREPRPGTQPTNAAADELADDEKEYRVCGDLTRRGGEPPRDQRRYSICALNPYATLETRGELRWSLGDERSVHVVSRSIGRGVVTVVNGSPFDNDTLLRDDDALLLSDSAGWRPGEQAVFLYGDGSASLLSLAWTHGAPVLVMLLLALAAALWRSFWRFGPAVALPVAARRSLREQIRGSSRFIDTHERGRPLLIALQRAVDEAAARRIPGWRALSRNEATALLARTLSLDVSTLARALKPPGHADRGDVAVCLACLETVCRQLSALAARKEN